MIFTGFRDTDLKKIKKIKNNNNNNNKNPQKEEPASGLGIQIVFSPPCRQKNPHDFYWVQGYRSRSYFPHRARGFKLTIEANGDQAEEEEAVEHEDKEEAVATELDGDDCGFKRRSFTRFVKGFGRICGLKGKNKVKWPLKS